ncbi:ABC transporter substrate-binding protein [Methylobacterium nodulans]|uniref:Extracellular ligand-binding receptor n=1 Tax=Methylobacterium nodulans (strain LMG 21967 / CNCM I-2342 / ORS 2060) TaxID=460265 RepID=B8IL17_METNO|nr:ABC transporter substrate-binding protein [Methylobacterium nodulans]ACL58205.1 Extracellular ligand-binding receptor [Methylobacterium nodulans ORS 2060]
MGIRALLRALCAGAVAVAAGSALAEPEALSVKIGVLTDLSSLYADTNGSGAVTATRMAVEDYEAAGGKVKAEVVAADHQNKPDVGSTITREWFDQGGVDVVVDVPNSAVALSVTELARQKNKVFMNSGASSSDFTGKNCTPNSIHWTYDTYALATGTSRAVVASGGDSWYLLTADYAFGHTMEADIRKILSATGAKVLGSARTPLNTPDFSSFLLQAQASKAKVVGLVNAGGDTINSIKQASEFGIAQGGQKIAAMVLYITDVHSLGLDVAQGLQFTAAYYWDLNDGTRAFAKRFAERMEGRMPTQLQAGAYSATLHYLKAVEKAGTKTDGKHVVEVAKSLPTDDPLFGKGTIRADGRKMHNMYLFETKTPSESKGPWDYYKLLRTIPAEEAFRPMGEGNCPIVSGSR